MFILRSGEPGNEANVQVGDTTAYLISISNVVRRTTLIHPHDHHKPDSGSEVDISLTNPILKLNYLCELNIHIATCRYMYIITMYTTGVLSQ